MAKVDHGVVTDDAAHTHHAIDYIEISVRDVAAAKRFYGQASVGYSTITAPVTQAFAGRTGRWAGSRKRTTSRPAVRS